MSYVFKPQWTPQGDGANVIRVIGNQYIKRLDPFLMLDHFKVRLPAGFPDHPHRGFETVTYMQTGSFYHQDFKGHKGIIGPGDVQWMTAGKGIVHAEMPASFDEDSIGFQLWLNLKAKDKMIDARYQEITKDQIPLFQKPGQKVKIICGKWQGHTGPINYATPAYYMDIQLQKDHKFEIPITATWNSIFYVYDGKGTYKCGQKTHEVKLNDCCVLQKGTNGQLVHSMTANQGGVKFIVISGQPINEPIVSYGPFVMNTQEEIKKTFDDYNMGVNGFENRKTWQSKIRHMSQGKGKKPAKN